MPDIEGSATPAQPEKRRLVPGHREYTLFLLTLVFAAQYLDRQVIVILTEPIKAEFQLSDAAMGLLHGLVFSVPYCLMLVPVGLMADRSNRRNLLAAALLVWSLLTMVTGLVKSVWQLAMVRAAIAAAESTNNPTALSIIADLYGPRVRATATGIFYAGPPLASLVGFVAVAWIAEAYGWRAGFFAAGVPGLLLGLVILLTVREPKREGGTNPALAVKPKLPETFRFIRRQRSAIHLMLAMMVVSIVSSGQLAWMVPFLMRGHGMSISEAAFSVSIFFGLVNAIGHIFGGAFVDRLGRYDVRWYVWAPGVFAVIGGAFMIGSGLSTDPTTAVIMMALWALPIGCQYGPVLGTVQSLTKPRMRGVATAMLVFGVNLVGAGGGPLLVGFLSDQLAPTAGEHSLQWSLALVALLELWAFTHFMLAARSLRTDLARIEAEGVAVI